MMIAMTMASRGRRRRSRKSLRRDAAQEGPRRARRRARRVRARRRERARPARATRLAANALDALEYHARRLLEAGSRSTATVGVDWPSLTFAAARPYRRRRRHRHSRPAGRRGRRRAGSPRTSTGLTPSRITWTNSPSTSSRRRIAFAPARAGLGMTARKAIVSVLAGNACCRRNPACRSGRRRCRPAGGS